MNKLREIRNKLGLSQMKLSDLLNCDQSEISKMEKGIYQIKIHHAYIIEKLCKNNGIEFSLEYLINNDSLRQHH